MRKNKRIFPCAKAVMLNTLYDAIDAISFHILSADSLQGMIEVSSLLQPASKGCITLLPSFSNEGTLVEVTSEDDAGCEWAAALLDEAESLIKRYNMEG